MSGPGAAGTLYQELILEHSRHPRHFGPLPGASHQAQRENPFCGDDITVSLALEGERIAGIQFEGAGCAISLAAASMMTEALAGRTRPEALALARQFFAMVSGEALSPGDGLGSLQAFAAVTRFPVRADCARLPWRALLAALGVETT
jgi:nitrogen fixation protein NifU and related proteins